MEYSRYLDCLKSDFTRLRAVAVADQTTTGQSSAVPSCPGWTVADLTRHVGGVYLHKVVAMREGQEPEPWPPAEFAREEPIALLDRGYTALTAEFAARQPDTEAYSWYAPDQTVAFWARRMAQETVIHRIDAELATGETVAPIPDDLAIDGIDELLRTFVAYSVEVWGSYFKDILDGSPAHTFAISTEGAAWHVRTGPGEFVVEEGDGPADLSVGGPRAPLLRWLWNRATEPEGVLVDGSPEALDVLCRCIVLATQ
jgi:uncharacterized protein (TIGR03083 family)